MFFFIFVILRTSRNVFCWMCVTHSIQVIFCSVRLTLCDRVLAPGQTDPLINRQADRQTDRLTDRESWDPDRPSQTWLDRAVWSKPTVQGLFYLWGLCHLMVADISRVFFKALIAGLTSERSSHNKIKHHSLYCPLFYPKSFYFGRM